MTAKLRPVRGSGNFNWLRNPRNPRNRNIVFEPDRFTRSPLRLSAGSVDSVANSYENPFDAMTARFDTAAELPQLSAARRQAVNMRTAAYMMAVEQVAAVHRIRGMYA